MKLARLFILMVILIGSQNLLAESNAGNQPSYASMEPAFVVNVNDGEHVRHMQVSVQLKLAKPEYTAYIEQYSPALRHAMVMLLSDQPVSKLKSAKGKIELGQQALTALQAVMQENIGVPAIEAVYFTDMIIQ